MPVNPLTNVNTCRDEITEKPMPANLQQSRVEAVAFDRFMPPANARDKLLVQHAQPVGRGFMLDLLHW
jgi:hypothetical protein